MAEVFISYSRTDIATAQAIIKFLHEKGYGTWRDVDNLPPGGIWTSELERAIRRSDAVLVLVSSQSMESEMVWNEALWARDEAKKPVIPLMLEDGLSLPMAFYRTQYIPMFTSWGTGCAALHDRLEALFDAPKASTLDSALAPGKGHAPASNINPFTFGSAVHERAFEGREKALETIRNRLSAGTLSSTSIVGERRIGKTSLLNYIAEQHADFLPAGYQWAFAYADMSDAQAKTTRDFMITLRESITHWTGNTSWEPEKDGEVAELSKAIDRIHASGTRLVLCLDEFEAALSYDEELSELFHTLRAAGSNGRIAIIVATRVPLDELYEQWGRTSPFPNIFGNIVLKPMPDPEWKALVTHAFEHSGQQVTESQINLIGRLSGGHPYLVQMAGYYVWDMRQLTWEEAEPQICCEFRQQARPYFKDLWLRLSPDGKNAVRKILNLSAAEPVKNRHIQRLKDYGLVTLAGDALFCKSFEDYLREALE